MSEDRKKPTAGFWTTVALVALLAYPVSYGPACWLDSRGWFPAVLHDAAICFYWPIGWLMRHGPQPIAKALWWWADLIPDR
jgi:hypothetical protein